MAKYSSAEYYWQKYILFMVLAIVNLKPFPDNCI